MSEASPASSTSRSTTASGPVLGVSRNMAAIDAAPFIRVLDDRPLDVGAAEIDPEMERPSATTPP